MSLGLELDVLPDADGSARYSSQGISILASVNGPLEVPRRDELPDKSTIEVSVRPSAGLAGIRERFFEDIIHKTLKQIIRSEQHPRTLIQITLQVTATPDTDSTYGRPSQSSSLLYLLPPLLNAAMLALLCSSIPLSATISSTITIVSSEGQIVAVPSFKQLQLAKSQHVMAYTSQGDLILVESEGSFGLKEWEACLESGKKHCIGAGGKDVDMIGEQESVLIDTFRQAIEARIQRSEQWRQHGQG